MVVLMGYTDQKGGREPVASELRRLDKDIEIIRATTYTQIISIVSGHEQPVDVVVIRKSNDNYNVEFENLIKIRDNLFNHDCRIVYLRVEGEEKLTPKQHEELYQNGIYELFYVSGGSAARDVAQFIINGRALKDTRDYYGLKQVTIPVWAVYNFGIGTEEAAKVAIEYLMDQCTPLTVRERYEQIIGGMRSDDQKVDFTLTLPDYIKGELQESDVYIRYGVEQKRLFRTYTPKLSGRFPFLESDAYRSLIRKILKQNQVETAERENNLLTDENGKKESDKAPVTPAPEPDKHVLEQTVVEQTPAPGAKKQVLDFAGPWKIQSPAGCERPGTRVRKRVSDGVEVKEYDELAATGHHYGAWEVRAGATCETDGERVQICENCGNEIVEVIPRTGHQLSDWVRIEKPDCEKPGKKERHCLHAGCTFSETDEVAFPGHNYGTWEVVVEATCAAVGNKQRVCSRCGKIDCAEIPKVSHRYELASEEEAACEKGGVKTYRCVWCGTERTEERPAMGHQFGKEQFQRPTCGEDGGTFRECIKCGYRHFKDKKKATGLHTFGTSIELVAPTCVKAGQKGKVCSVCGKRVGSGVIEPTGVHAFSEWERVDETTERRYCVNDGCKYEEKRDIVVEALVPAPAPVKTPVEDLEAPVVEVAEVAEVAEAVAEQVTDKEEGGDITPIAPVDDITMVSEDKPDADIKGQLDSALAPVTSEKSESSGRVCKKCGAAFGMDTRFLAFKSATCSAEGMEGTFCLVCGAPSNWSIPKLSHRFGAWGSDSKDCLRDRRVCVVCGAVDVRESVSPHHRYGADFVRVTPTCTTDGVKSKRCAVCGDVADIGTIPMAGHQLSDWCVSVPAKCGVTGVEERHCAAEGCNFKETRELAALSHIYGDWVRMIAPSCVTEGKETRTCSICGDVIERPVAKTEHILTDWNVETDARCGVVGVEERHCKTEGCNFKETREIAALDHAYGAWEQKQAPTCISCGELVRVCTLCGDTEQKEIPMKGEHTFSDWCVSVPAKCGTAGEKERHCTIEGCDFRETLELPALSHIYGDWVRMIAPSCVTEGKETRTCSICGDVIERPVAKTEHILTDWNVETDARCGVVGVEERHCKTEGCDFKEIRSIPALSHDYGLWETVKAPTCVAEGEMKRVCTLCGDSLTEYLPIIKEHKLSEWSVKKDAACEVTGVEERHCAAEGCNFKETRELAALSHIYGDWVRMVAPSCVTEGKEIKTCSLCGDVIERSVATTEHVLTDWSVETAARCGVVGVEERHCKTEGCDFKETRGIPALTHIYGEWETVKEPTCVAEGLKRRLCTLCGNAEEERLPVTGEHALSEWAEKIPAGCEKAGEEERHCINEGCTYSEVRPLPAHSHQFGDWVEVTVATCVSDGLRERTCTLCGKRITETLGQLSHQLSDWAVEKPARCGVNGVGERHCNRNACEYKETRELAALTHIYGGWVQMVAPSCIKAGIEEQTCSLCGESISRETAKTDHVLTDWAVDTAAVCEKEGREERHCKTEGCDFKEIRPIPALSHDYGLWETVKEPTCVAEGLKKKVCFLCGAEINEKLLATGEHLLSKWAVVSAALCLENGLEDRHCLNEGCDYSERREISAVGHNFDPWEEVKAPTCYNEGERQRICNLCGTVESDVIPMLEHDLTDWAVEMPAMCNSVGTSERHCKNDGCTFKQTQELAVLNHAYGKWVEIKAPTCISAGQNVKTCALCGKNEYEDLPLTEHILSAWNDETPAKCGVPGVSERHCLTKCCSYRETKELAALAHTYRQPFIKEQPTCKSNGVMVKTCTLCGDEILVKSLSRVGHRYGTWVEIKAPTCKEKGLSGRYCEYCNKEVTKTLPALGHEFKKNDKGERVCIRCGKKKKQKDLMLLIIPFAAVVAIAIIVVLSTGHHAEPVETAGTDVVIVGVPDITTVTVTEETQETTTRRVTETTTEEVTTAEVTEEPTAEVTEEPTAEVTELSTTLEEAEGKTEEETTTTLTTERQTATVTTAAPTTAAPTTATAAPTTAAPTTAAPTTAAPTTAAPTTAAPTTAAPTTAAPTTAAPTTAAPTTAAPTTAAPEKVSDFSYMSGDIYTGEEVIKFIKAHNVSVTVIMRDGTKYTFSGGGDTSRVASDASYSCNVGTSVVFNQF